MLFTSSLRKSFQFQKVYNKGKSFADRNLVMFVLKNNSSQNFLGVCVSKKVGKSHVRSRVTRLIKENYRLAEELFCCGFDIVFMARKNIIDADFRLIGKSMLGLSRKHGVLL